nr:hypothetical protein CFP56_24252 [Quercus suber]
MAVTATSTYQDSLDSQYLSTSLSNLSRSRSTNTFIVRAYRQATQLYLTRQFKDALDVLETIIVPQSLADADTEDDEAPIAQSSKGTRTKVWVFYLSIINAIIELGPEEGRAIFGIVRWRQIASKAREGTVWDEIVQNGYNGIEGDVDADVVVNLSTLLLGHMPTQQLNQQKLETWLASSNDANPLMMFGEGIGSPLPPGAQTPKALATRLRVLELYALHILPLNEEWEYSQSFIEMNDTLDEESKEAFLQALETLKEEKEGTALREQALKEQRERETEEQQRRDDAERAENARKEEEARKSAELERQQQQKRANNPHLSSNGLQNGHLPGANGTGSTKAGSSTGRPPSTSSQTPPPPRPKTPKKPSRAQTPAGDLYHRATSVFASLQQMVVQASRGLDTMVVMRLLMFILAFLIIAARRDLRMKIRRIMGDGWDKVKRTVGMGVKVSYI